MSEQTQADPTELMVFVTRENLASEDLDELVYELCGAGASVTANQDAEAAAEGHISDGERRASDINNGGLEEQVPFIAAAYPNLSEAKRAIMDAQ